MDENREISRVDGEIRSETVSLMVKLWELEGLEVDELSSDSVLVFGGIPLEVSLTYSSKKKKGFKVLDKTLTPSPWTTLMANLQW